MKKKIVLIVVMFLVLTLVLPYVYVEIMSAVYYDETVNLYEKTGLISSDNYHKVFWFSQDNAKVLYSEPHRVVICEFSKDENGVWQYENIEPVLFRNNLELLPFNFSIPEKNIYPLYLTKHLIEPEESKENFDLYEKELKILAESENLSFDVMLAENAIDRIILLSDKNNSFVINLFNDYDGSRGYEKAEIFYTCTKGFDFDLNLLVRIQEKILHKIANEKNIAAVFAPDEIFNEAKLVRDIYPDAYEINSMDILGNGEYLLSYIETKNDEIILISGTTKRAR
ncbi:MAG: hypothetical protein IJ025_01060 [Clostridia bacterium]|nr:hypothetical protein [Clostridia bacterium]